MNVPASVIKGISPRKTSCSLTSPVSWINTRASTFKGAANVTIRSFASFTEYLGASKEYSPNSSDIFPVKLSTGNKSSKTSLIPLSRNHWYDFFWISNKSASSKLLIVLEKVALSLWSPNFAILYATKFHPKQYIFLVCILIHREIQLQFKIILENMANCQR